MIDKNLMFKLLDSISVFGGKYSVVCDNELGAIRVRTSTGCITSTLLDTILGVSDKIVFNSFSVSKVDDDLFALFFVKDYE